MSEKLFSKSNNLHQVHDILLEHLSSHSYVMIRQKNHASIYLPDNGEVSFWFDDLVKLILTKVLEKDPEIIEICFKNNINLFDIQIKK